MLESILSMLQSSVTDAQKAAAAAQLNAKREEPALASASAKFEQQRQVLTQAKAQREAEVERRSALATKVASARGAATSAPPPALLAR